MSLRTYYIESGSVSSQECYVSGLQIEDTVKLNAVEEFNAAKDVDSLRISRCF